MIEKIRPVFGTSAKLKDIPREWLTLVEPRIVRKEIGRGCCWLWDGGCDRDGEPVFNIVQPNGKRTMRRVKRFVAGLFWKLTPNMDVVHQCGVQNCLNPSHFYISAAHYSQEGRTRATKKVASG